MGEPEKSRKFDCHAYWRGLNRLDGRWSLVSLDEHTAFSFRTSLSGKVQKSIACINKTGIFS
jgi:hypothetical protein